MGNSSSLQNFQVTAEISSLQDWHSNEENQQLSRLWHPLVKMIWRNYKNRLSPKIQSKITGKAIWQALQKMLVASQIPARSREKEAYQTVLLSYQARFTRAELPHLPAKLTVVSLCEADWLMIDCSYSWIIRQDFRGVSERLHSLVKQGSWLKLI